jgi:hypothetical protein
MTWEWTIVAIAFIWLFTEWGKTQHDLGIVDQLGGHELLLGDDVDPDLGQELSSPSSSS